VKSEANELPGAPRRNQTLQIQPESLVNPDTAPIRGMTLGVGLLGHW
jgi:hypothetical protein